MSEELSKKKQILKMNQLEIFKVKSSISWTEKMVEKNG